VYNRHDGTQAGELGDTKVVLVLDKLIAVLSLRLIALELPHNKLSESAAYAITRAMPSFQVWCDSLGVSFWLMSGTLRVYSS
jgi:hypothetical protein